MAHATPKTGVPATPGSQGSATSTPATGTWRHPRFDEITRRQNASAFTSRNVAGVAWNGGAIVVLYNVCRIGEKLGPYASPPSFIRRYGSMAIAGLYLLFIFNILRNLLPLFVRKDNLSDIPLTPSQRALLGLDPNTSSAGPYVTPPRYALNSTPGSRSSIGTPRSVSTGGVASPSPLSGKGANNTLQRRTSNSPFSPSPAKPIGYGPFGSATPLGKGKDLFANRRYSYGSPTSYDNPAVGIGAETPSPPAGKAASIVPSSRWIYEKGRESILGR